MSHLAYTPASVWARSARRVCRGLAAAALVSVLPLWPQLSQAQASANSSTSATAVTPAIKVEDAWARATVPGQKGTGAFMRITARDGAKLVGASSPAAGVVEVHEMKMDGGVMKMRAISALELPAGQTVELKPGGYHVMMMDLKAGLPNNTTVPIVLMFKDARGGDSRVELSVPVSLSAPAGASGAAGAGGMGAHKH